MSSQQPEQVDTTRHIFVESEAHGNEYNVVIYCKACGKVVWHFNKADMSKDVLQKNVGIPCVKEER